jgi:membrane protease YdiL (CAAX protease family)
MNDVVIENPSHRFRVLGRVVLFMFGCAFVLAAAVPFIPKLPGLWSELCLGGITSLAAFGLTVLFVRWDGVRLEDIGAAPGRQIPLRFLSGLFMGMLLVAIWALLSATAGYVRWVRGSDVEISAAVTALFAYIALSCREELGFRGYPLRRLERPLGMWGAQLFVAFVFVVEHRIGGSPWTQAVFGAGIGSLLFGMAAIATRGLAIPIGLHAAWNFGQWTLGLKGQTGLWKGVVEQGLEERAEVVGMSMYVAVMGLATLAFWLWHRRVNRALYAQEQASIN